MKGDSSLRNGRVSRKASSEWNSNRFGLGQIITMSELTVTSEVT